ncbi:hypothetical protein, partial [Kitasatospora sp. NPDC004289]
RQRQAALTTSHSTRKTHLKIKIKNQNQRDLIPVERWSPLDHLGSSASGLVWQVHAFSGASPALPDSPIVTGVLGWLLCVIEE